MPPVLLSPHFSLAEFERSETAAARGLANRMPEAYLANARTLCTQVLEPLRGLLRRPVSVLSGYRSPAVNRAVGGSETSQHRKGQAADLDVRGYTPAELFETIRRSGIPFDQLILEFPPDGWVHVSYRRRPACRRQALVARKVDGVTVYSVAPPAGTLLVPGVTPA